MVMDGDRQVAKVWKPAPVHRVEQVGCDPIAEIERSYRSGLRWDQTRKKSGQRSGVVEAESVVDKGYQGGFRVDLRATTHKPQI